MRPLRQHCEAGMGAQGLGGNRRTVEPLEYEPGMTRKLEYEAYFLAVTPVA